MAERKRKSRKKNPRRSSDNFRVVVVVVLHVGDGVNADQTADDTDNEGHDEGEVIDIEGVLHGGGADRKFGIGSKPRLDDKKGGNPGFALFDVLAAPEKDRG